MSEVSNAIRKKSILLNNIVVHIKSYYLNINEYAWKYAAEMLAKYKELEVILDKYHNTLNHYPKIEEYTIETLPSLIELFDLWGDIRNTLEKIYLLLSDDSVIRYISIGMSQTYIAELYMKLSSIKMLFASLTITDAEINQTIIESAKQSILPSLDENGENKLTDILVSGKINDVVFGFLSAFKPKSKNNIHRVNDYSNGLKNKFLSAKGVIETGHDLPTEMQLISRFSLIPATEYMSAEKISELIKGPAVTINKHTSKPMQYNIMPLLSLDYVVAANMITSETSGLNKKILKRFGIIKELPHVESPPNTKHISIEPNAKYIVESLNGKYFRVLHNGIPEAKDYTSSEELIKTLTTGPSDVYDRYNKISTPAIISKCVNKEHKKLMVSFMETQFKSNSSFSLKEQIVSDYMKVFSAAFVPGNKQPSAKKVRFMIADIISKTKNVLRNRLLLYVFNIPTRSLEGRLLFDEIKLVENFDTEAVITFDVKFESTYKEFSREMYNQLSDVMNSGILTNQQTEDPAEQHKNILFACNKIISGAVDVMDSKPSRWINMDITIKNVAIKTGLY